MAPQIDFSNISDSFEPIPDGIYDAVLSEVAVKVSQKGDDYLAFTFTLTDEYEGRKAWRNFSLLPQSLWALKGALVAFGVDKDDLTGSMTMEGLVELCTSNIGSACRLELTIKEWNSKLSNDVKKVMAA